MKIKLKVITNKKIYQSLNLNNDDILEIENYDQWSDFFFQNKQRKNNNIPENEKFKIKRIIKNLKGFELILNQVKLDTNVCSGYFLDYSSYVNVFNYFQDQSQIIEYIKDTSEARGEKIKINSFDDAIRFLANEDVVVSEVLLINIKKNDWDEFVNSYVKQK